LFSNPPYIAKDDPQFATRDLRFEPAIALTDSADGLTAYRRISQDARPLLTSQGFLNAWSMVMTKLFLFNTFFQTNMAICPIHTEKDYSGLERVTICQKG
jgi:release factor glutamine methyltransferase